MSRWRKQSTKNCEHAMLLSSPVCPTGKYYIFCELITVGTLNRRLKKSLTLKLR